MRIGRIALLLLIVMFIAGSVQAGWAGAGGSGSIIAPAISNFAPASGPVGTAVVITGTNFQPVLTYSGVTGVQFNGVNATFTVDSSTQITATVPVAATTGPIKLISNTISPSSATNFTVTAGPLVTAFNPTVGGFGQTVNVTGSGFTGVTAVTFGGIAATTFNFVDDNHVTADVPAAAVSGPIAVTANGLTGASATVFTVLGSPAVLSFTPGSGLPGTVVRITGTDLANTDGVSFNGKPAAQFNVIDDQTVDATVPAGATTGPISLTASGGRGISTTPFVVLLPPVITGFTPTTGVGGTVVRITGTGFTGTNSVQIGGVDAASFTVVDDRDIDAVVGATAATGTVQVTTAGGTATAQTQFTLQSVGGGLVSSSPIEVTVQPGAAGSVGSITIRNSGNVAHTLPTVTVSVSNASAVASGTLTVTGPNNTTAQATASPANGTLTFQFSNPVTLQPGDTAILQLTLVGGQAATALKMLLPFATLAFASLALVPRPRGFRGLLTLVLLGGLTLGLGGCGGGEQQGSYVTGSGTVAPVTQPGTLVTSTVSVTQISARAADGTTSGYTGLPVQLGPFHVQNP